MHEGVTRTVGLAWKHRLTKLRAALSTALNRERQLRRYWES